MNPNQDRVGRLLAIYLQNHEAAAQSGVDLFRRAAGTQKRRDYGHELADLRDEVVEDAEALRGVLRVLGVRPNPVLALGLRLGERVGRLKLNGSVVRRSPLSDLLELEALANLVRAKAGGWRALLAADVDQIPGMPDLPELIRRAERQAVRLDGLHQAAAQRVLH